MRLSGLIYLGLFFFSGCTPDNGQNAPKVSAKASNSSSQVTTGAASAPGISCPYYMAQYQDKCGFFWVPAGSYVDEDYPGTYKKCPQGFTSPGASSDLAVGEAFCDTVITSSVQNEIVGPPFPTATPILTETVVPNKYEEVTQCYDRKVSIQLKTADDLTQVLKCNKGEAFGNGFKVRRFETLRCHSPKNIHGDKEGTNSPVYEKFIWFGSNSTTVDDDTFRVSCKPLQEGLAQYFPYYEGDMTLYGSYSCCPLSSKIQEKFKAWKLSIWEKERKGIYYSYPNNYFSIPDITHHEVIEVR